MKSENVLLDGKEYNNVSFIIGLSLAISSSLFIGSSFIIKKIALKKIDASGSVRASAGGFAYLKQWMWWLGLITSMFPIYLIKNIRYTVIIFSIKMCLFQWALGRQPTS